MRVLFSLMALLLTMMALAQEEPAEPAEPVEPAAAATQTVADTSPDEVKTMSGMSILGNEEAPKSLVIVPWKSSKLGDGLGIANSLDESPRPVDREVFMREVHFYDLRSGAHE